MSETEKNWINDWKKNELETNHPALFLERVTNDFLRNSNRPSSKLKSENVSLITSKNINDFCLSKTSNIFLSFFNDSFNGIFYYTYH